MILPIERRKEILTILVNKKWIQRKKDTISAEYDERKVFSYLKKRRRKKKILKVTRPFPSSLPNPHTHKKKSKQDRRDASPVSSWAITKKCRSTVEHVYFFRFWFELPKKDFTLLFISLVGTTHVSSTAASKACKITMEAMAGRIEQTARPGCTSYSPRSENHQLPSNSDWVEKHLKKNRQNILQQQPQKQITEWAASLHQQPCEKAASKAQKTIDRKKELFTLPKKN